jgi:hypothetical protein
VEPLVKARMEKALEDGASEVGLLQLNETATLDQHQFVVTATEPNGLGIVDKNTFVYVDWDTTPEFEKVHVLPFSDTLPRAYEYDLFEDYLRPYFASNPSWTFRRHDTFKYRGIQFKVMCTEPEDIVGRVGKRSLVFSEGHLNPSLRDLLPPELAAQIARFPPGLQMLLLSSDAIGSDVYERLVSMQEMLQQRRGLDNQTIDRIPTVTWTAESKQEHPGDQDQCMVCLCDFEVGEELNSLPCGHLFHPGCIQEWLSRCTECPLCKADVDRSIREY